MLGRQLGRCHLITTPAARRHGESREPGFGSWQDGGRIGQRERNAHGTGAGFYPHPMPTVSTTIVIDDIYPGPQPAPVPETAESDRPAKSLVAVRVYDRRANKAGPTDSARSICRFCLDGR
jgi:hypothetical protein